MKELIWKYIWLITESIKTLVIFTVHRTGTPLNKGTKSDQKIGEKSLSYVYKPLQDLPIFLQVYPHIMRL